MEAAGGATGSLERLSGAATPLRPTKWRSSQFGIDNASQEQIESENDCGTDEAEVPALSAQQAIQERWIR